MTIDLILSQGLGPRVAKLTIDRDLVIDDVEPGDWFIAEYDKETVSIVHLSQNGENVVAGADGRATAYRVLTFYTFGVSDVSFDQVIRIIRCKCTELNSCFDMVTALLHSGRRG
jgi:hypothetical protein